MAAADGKVSQLVTPSWADLDGKTTSFGFELLEGLAGRHCLHLLVWVVSSHFPAARGLCGGLSGIADCCSELLMQQSRGRAQDDQVLEALELFRETMKRTYYMPSAVFLGLSVTDTFASLAISDDCYLTARTYGLFHRNEALLDRLVDRVQSLKKDSAPPVYIHNFMDDLCKKGKLESLKYTYWRDNFTSSVTSQLMKNSLTQVDLTLIVLFNCTTSSNIWKTRSRGLMWMVVFNRRDSHLWIAEAPSSRHRFNKV